MSLASTCTYTEILLNLCFITKGQSYHHWLVSRLTFLSKQRMGEFMVTNLCDPQFKNFMIFNVWWSALRNIKQYINVGIYCCSLYHFGFAIIFTLWKWNFLWIISKSWGSYNRKNKQKSKFHKLHTLMFLSEKRA